MNRPFELPAMNGCIDRNESKSFATLASTDLEVPSDCAWAQTVRERCPISDQSFDIPGYVSIRSAEVPFPRDKSNRGSEPPLALDQILQQRLVEIDAGVHRDVIDVGFHRFVLAVASELVDRLQVVGAHAFG